MSGKRGGPRGGRQGQGNRGRQAPPRGRSGGRPPARQRPDERGSSRRRPDQLGGDHIEGRQAVREVLKAGNRRVQELLIAEDVDETAIIAEIEDLAIDRRVEVRRLTRRRLDEKALTESHQGVVATAEPLRPVPLEQLLQPHRGEPPFLVALDGVTDPGNLGAVLRTAEVAGATGVVLPRHRAVRLTPAAVKAAAGAIEYLRIALVGGLPAAITQASEAGVWPIGLDGDGRETIHDIRVADEPIMLVLGAEGRGLSQLVHRRCEQVVSIPQRGRVQSLNVSAAAAVALYEVRRRRDLA